MGEHNQPPKSTGPQRERQARQERRSGEGSASALERLRALEKAKAAAQPGKQKPGL